MIRPGKPSGHLDAESLSIALRDAVLQENIAEIHRLIDEGAAVERSAPLEGPVRMSPAQLAAAKGKPKALCALISRGADVNRAPLDSHGNPPLSHAAYHSPACVPILLQAGADPNIRGTHTGSRPLHNASLRGHDETIELLLDYGAEIDIANYKEEIPFFKASASGKPSAVQLLLDRGSQGLAAHTITRENCLHFAADNHRTNPDLVKFLLQRIPEELIDEKAEDGYTPTMKALGPHEVDDFESIEGVVALTAELVVPFIEKGAKLNRPFPAFHLWHSMDKHLSVALEPYLDRIKRGPIPCDRRTLHWAVRSPSVAERRTSLNYTAGAEKAAEELSAVRDERLSLLRENAWRRRRHLCLDRALWRKPAPTTSIQSSVGAVVKAGAGKESSQ
jgi:Ankyrin repeats (3 copies)